MKALFLTNEYPPYIYGGAGVHVDYLSRELAKSMPVEVRCFGDQKLINGNLRVTGFELDASGFNCPKALQSVFGAVRRCTDFNTANIDSDIVHCHTWYSHFGGILAKLNYGLPLVITVHSLEPLRPWKREQLGGGYDFSVWLERTALEMADAVIAVSSENKSGRRAVVSRRSQHASTSSTTGLIPRDRKIESTTELRSCVGSIPQSPTCFSWEGSPGKRESFISLGRLIHGPWLPGSSLRRSARHAANRGGNESRLRACQSKTSGCDLG